MANPIGNIGTVPVFNIGNSKNGESVITDLTSNLIALVGYTSATANGSTMRKSGTTSGYQVTAGKTYTIKALKSGNYSTGTSCTINLAQSNNDIGWNAAVSGITGGVYFADSATWAFASGGDVTSSTGDQHLSYAITFAIAATRFVTVTNGATGNAAGTKGCHAVYGYEA